MSFFSCGLAKRRLCWSYVDWCFLLRFMAMPDKRIRHRKRMRSRMLSHCLRRKIKLLSASRPRTCRTISVKLIVMLHYLRTPYGLHRDAGVAFALRSGGQSRFWLVYRPERTLSAADRVMLTRLQGISAPSVLKGTVIVAITYKIHGGQPEKGDKWIPMPKEWSKVAADNGWKLSTEQIVDRLWPGRHKQGIKKSRDGTSTARKALS